MDVQTALDNSHVHVTVPVDPYEDANVGSLGLGMIVIYFAVLCIFLGLSACAPANPDPGTTEPKDPKTQVQAIGESAVGLSYQDAGKVVGIDFEIVYSPTLGEYLMAYSRDGEVLVLALSPNDLSVEHYELGLNSFTSN